MLEFVSSRGDSLPIYTSYTSTDYFRGVSAVYQRKNEIFVLYVHQFVIFPLNDIEGDVFIPSCPVLEYHVEINLIFPTREVFSRDLSLVSRGERRTTNEQ